MMKITVTASGPRGCGKSTHLKIIRELLAQHGYVITWTDHPDVEGFTCTPEDCLAEWHKQDEAFRKMQDAEREGRPHDHRG